MRNRILLFALVAAAGCRQAADPTLVVTCSATPAAGPAPLTVAFAVNVSGAAGSLQLRVDYGDGQSGTDAAQPHTYVRAGLYSAAFSVTADGQTALCTAPVRVDPPATTPSAPTPTPTPPVPSGPNQPPFAVFRTTPTPPPGDLYTGSRAVTIEFNMCRSSDPENDPLNFTMDFEGDGILEVNGQTGGDCRRTHTFTVPGRYQPRICVTDVNSGLTPLHGYQCRSYAVRVGPV